MEHTAATIAERLLNRTLMSTRPHTLRKMKTDQTLPPEKKDAKKLEASGGRVPRLVGRHYRVTWLWNDTQSPRHGELVTSNYYGPIGSAKDFYKRHRPGLKVVKVRMTHPHKRQSGLPNETSAAAGSERNAHE